MMDDLTQEEINIIMNLRKNENDKKIQQEIQIQIDEQQIQIQIDKEKMSVFIPLYLKKKQKKAEMLDLQKKYTEIQDIFKKEYDDIREELVKTCVHYADTKGRIYDDGFGGRYYYCPSCDYEINNICKYTNVWDEGAIIKNFTETINKELNKELNKGHINGNMTNEDITNKINTHNYNYNLLRIMLEMPDTIYPDSD